MSKSGKRANGINETDGNSVNSKTRFITWLCSIAVVGLVCPSVAWGDLPQTATTKAIGAAGSIQGVVTYHADTRRPWRYARYYVRDRRQGQLAEAVVALKSVKVKRSVPGREVEMDQKDYQFVPETLAIHAGDTVKFLNSDDTIHNVVSYHRLKSFNVNLPHDDTHRVTFKNGGGISAPFRIGCSYHSSMRAWIFVFNHPYFSITKPDGRFSMKNVPAGSYELEMVHPAGKLGWKKSITVHADKVTQVKISVSPDDLQD